MSSQATTPPGFWTVWTAVAVDLLGFGIVLPLLPLYAEQFGAGPVTIGLLFASYSLAQTVFAPLWGKVSDRIGRKPVLIIAIAGSAAGSLIVALAGSVSILFVGRIVDGASGASVAVARAAVADSAAPGDRALLMGLLGAAFGLGFVAGPVLGAAAVLAGPSAPFLAAAAISALNLVAAVFRLPETRAAETPDRGASCDRRRLPGLVSRFVTLTFLALTAFGAFEATFALLGSDRFAMTESVVALSFAGLGSLFVAVQALAIGPITHSIGEGGALRLGLLLAATGYAAVAVAQHWTLLAAGLAVLAIGQGITTPVLSASITAVVPAERSGAALGLQHAAGGVARLVGPVVGGFLFAQSVSLPFAAAAVLALASAAFAISPHRYAVPEGIPAP